jgi:hypothetical protein
MSGQQSSTHATGRATAATTAAGGLKAAQDQIRALLADKATDKREAAAATKAAQKAVEKATREAVASALAGHQPPLRQPPQLPPDDEEAFHGADDRFADEDRELKDRLWNALEGIERRLPPLERAPAEDPRVTEANAEVAKAKAATHEAELRAALISSQVSFRNEARGGGARGGGAHGGGARGGGAVLASSTRKTGGRCSRARGFDAKRGEPGL